ncbi:hypothetical protein TrVFT333_002063 [Trichoderma virens FT-333]|nr:hypothetical protein TrVFT333_002063 [Trichoderma virens FT-333]
MSASANSDNGQNHKAISYENNRPGFSVNVETLLWADGVEGSPSADQSNTSDQPMTLAILKFELTSQNKDVEFTFMNASLKLEATDDEQHQGLNDPELKAWTKVHGVTWAIQDNELGIVDETQNFWAAVLISRTSSKPYLVNFQIEGRVELRDENGVVQFLGLNRPKAEPFKITPGEGIVCNSEGENHRRY